MDEVSIKIPYELYKQLEEEALKSFRQRQQPMAEHAPGRQPLSDTQDQDNPVDRYVAALIAGMLRERPNIIEVEDVDAFLQALQPWEQVVASSSVDGATWPGFKLLPRGKTQVTAEGSFQATGPRITVHTRIGELSDRFRKDNTPHGLNYSLLSATFGPSPHRALALERVPPLDAEDLAIIERSKAVHSRIREALTKVGVRPSEQWMNLWRFRLRRT